ncbi:DUF4424 domain-containing protein [Parasphingorhabdus litoris]|uniref:DUF4424 domain-containing protein n=1 Tax=Parasphingorhabdus litoris TaxID=394733 RepID=A0ABN1AAC8_9SPHN|nr:DUF4424 family protein [Parasphingorhabdus litoris]
MKLSAVLSALFLLAIAAPARANDSAAAVRLGGLELKQNDAISMDSEELFLSLKRVIVKYEFTNTTDRDITTLVSFPLPALPHEIGAHFGDQKFPDWKAIDFQTKVNGKAVTLEYRDIITADGKDITQRVKQLGWPTQYWLDHDFQRKLEQLPKAELDKYLTEGLIKRSARGMDHYIDWQVSTHITREQTFPANQTIKVEHSYRPITGGTNGGNMSANVRGETSDYGFKWFQKNYCIDDNFIASFDETYYSRFEEKREQYVELFLDYRLLPGANWQGPIKKFRLVVEKPSPSDLISFCMDDVRKISPIQYEVVKRNFEPKQDLKLLFVDWFEYH